jgi:hypothetical protein
VKVVVLYDTCSQSNLIASASAASMRAVLGLESATKGDTTYCT